MVSLFIVDDGTAVIPCIRWIVEPRDQTDITLYDSINLGDHVTIHGKLVSVREEKEIKIERICILYVTLYEFMHHYKVSCYFYQVKYTQTDMIIFLHSVLISLINC